MKQIAFITGSSRGIGKAIALQLAMDGFDIIIHGSKDSQELRKTEKELKKINSHVFSVYFDVKDKKQVVAGCQSIYKKVKDINVLINNAGIIRDRTLLKMSFEEWDEVIRTNLYGSFLVTQQVLPTMKAKKYGRIINISSMIGIKGNFGQTNYAASKAGIIGFTKALAKEVSQYNITCNVVCPGVIKTDAVKNVSNKLLENLTCQTLIKKAGSPSDVANVVSMLSQKKSDFITGSTIEVSGGWL